MGDGAFRITSRRMVSDGRVTAATARIEGGVIQSVEEGSAAGADVIDCGDLVVMAGVVDSHVHVNEPGRTEWEGFVTATRAAAAGGVTTIVDMPLNSVPATVGSAALALKAAAARGKCVVDYGFWGGVVPGNTGELQGLLEGGALGFKCFMSPSGVDEFMNVNEAQLREAMVEIARLGSVLLAHAELPRVLEAQAWKGDERSYAAYLATRPPEAELEAVELLIRLSKETGCRAHIVHVATERAIAMIAQAKAAGARISAETCPHYLVFAAEGIPDGATEYKCAPPIRSGTTREGLWRGLVSGALDLVATDHSPCPPQMKGMEAGSFAEAWGGIASLQCGLPAVWTEAHRLGIDVGMIARWMCEGPAQLAGLDGRKGRIAAGYDADLVVWDPDAEFVFATEQIEHRHKVTPYAGRRFKGVVHKTYVRGRSVFEDGAIVDRCEGEWLRSGRTA